MIESVHTHKLHLLFYCYVTPVLYRFFSLLSLLSYLYVFASCPFPSLPYYFSPAGRFLLLLWCGMNGVWNDVQLQIRDSFNSSYALDRRVYTY